MNRARLLCQKERGLKKQRESKRSWASEEGESWALVEGAQRVLQGPQRGNVEYWRGCGACGGRSALEGGVQSALVRSVCTVKLGGDLDVATWV